VRARACVVHTHRAGVNHKRLACTCGCVCVCVTCVCVCVRARAIHTNVWTKRVCMCDTCECMCVCDTSTRPYVLNPKPEALNPGAHVLAQHILNIDTRKYTKV
jgi:hypothetical protein